MGTITYFFELYDDDGDGKVDREGILRVSEALLFLSRRGLEGVLSNSNSTTMLNGIPEADSTSLSPPIGGTVNERFLGSVSAFIRRCFEYADPDHPGNQDEVAQAKSPDASFISQEDSPIDEGAFTIGDDGDDEEEEEEEDLLAFDGTSTQSHTADKTKLDPGSIPPAIGKLAVGDITKRAVSKAQSEKANIALDPSNPLHITLPTFRMVVLADELLEQFFESSFPTSLHIIDGLPNPASQSSSLTTFSSLNFNRPAVVSPSGTQPGLAGAGRGLRGVLDNIVTDASRVAAEVRRRMEEAQRELEKNALPGQRDDDDEDDEDLQGPIKSSGAYSGDAERRSVRSSDRDLLDGADADAGASKEIHSVSQSGLDADNEQEGRIGPADNATQRIVEFES